mgnify:CR=1 FL=1
MSGSVCAQLGAQQGSEAAVLTWVCLSLTLGMGGVVRCFSSHSPVMGLLWRKMKCTLFVSPHLSGPNMIVYGVDAWKPSSDSSSDAVSSLR